MALLVESRGGSGRMPSSTTVIVSSGSKTACSQMALRSSAGSWRRADEGLGSGVWCSVSVEIVGGFIVRISMSIVALGSYRPRRVGEDNGW